MRVFLFFTLILLASGLWGQSFSAEPTGLLGLDPAKLLDTLGPPRQVHALRGPEPGLDDVVFEYQSGLSVFFFIDRVWQVHLQKPWPEPFLGFSLGVSPDRVISVLGMPSRSGDSFYEWDLPGAAYFLRLRTILDADEKISEAYIYRADF